MTSALSFRYILRCSEGMVNNGGYTELISNLDLTPTLLEMVGAEVPDVVPGAELLRSTHRCGLRGTDRGVLREELS